MEWRHYQSTKTKRKEWKVLCPVCGKEQWVRVSKHKAKNYTQCLSCSVKSRPQEVKDRIAETLRQKYKTDPEFAEKIKRARKMPSGDKHWNWKGGLTPLNQRTRTSEDASIWKLAVLSRDNFMCRICNSTENLQAHHINGWAEFPEDRFILENGLTLCKTCHDFYHKYEKEVRKNGDH